MWFNGRLHFNSADAFKTPGRFVITKPLQKNTELNGFKEGVENFIATKFLGKPADVQLEFDPGLGYWAKRKIWETITTGGSAPLNKKGKKLPVTKNSQNDIVPWSTYGLSLDNTYVLNDGLGFPSFIAQKTAEVIPIATEGLPQVPENRDDMMRLSYPNSYSKLRPAPIYAPILEQNQNDLIGALSLSGPFADDIEWQADIGKFVIDFSDYEQHLPKDGLYKLGGKVLLDYDKHSKQMKTSSIVYQGTEYLPDSSEWKTIQKIVQATQATEITAFKHVIRVHQIIGETFSIINQKYLDQKHPLRILMQPHEFNTIETNKVAMVLALKNEYQELELMSSYDLEELYSLLNKKIKSFNIEDMDLRKDLNKRGMNLENIVYPYHENAGTLWDILSNYVEKYVDHYYGNYLSEDEFIESEPEIVNWYQDLNKYIPNGIENYAGGLSRESLKKLLTLFVFNVTAQHRNVGFLNFNYLIWEEFSMQVRTDGKRSNIGMHQENVNSKILSQVPSFNLLQDFSYLALDDGAREIIQDFIKHLTKYQAKLDAQGSDANKLRLDPREIFISVSS